MHVTSLYSVNCTVCFYNNIVCKFWPQYRHNASLVLSTPPHSPRESAMCARPVSVWRLVRVSSSLTRSATSWGASNQQHLSSQDASGECMQHMYVHNVSIVKCVHSQKYFDWCMYYIHVYTMYSAWKSRLVYSVHVYCMYSAVCTMYWLISVSELPVCTGFFDDSVSSYTYMYM